MDDSRFMDLNALRAEGVLGPEPDWLVKAMEEIRMCGYLDLTQTNRAAASEIK
jgi:hypothetical protein